MAAGLVMGSGVSPSQGTYGSVCACTCSKRSSTAASLYLVQGKRTVDRALRSSQNRPESTSLAANHTIVSAPCSAVRRIGAVKRRNPGSES